MGYIRRLDSNADIQAFPGANFELTGLVPAPQCSEAKIEGTNGQIFDGGWTFVDFGAFAGFNLAGKVLHITAPPSNVGDYAINTNTDDSLAMTDVIPTVDPNNVYFITDGGELILTRNVQSFAQFIHAAGYAYTIKGGKLYTDMPNGLLKDACTILFDPLT